MSPGVWLPRVVQAKQDGTTAAELNPNGFFLIVWDGPVGESLGLIAGRCCTFEFLEGTKALDFVQLVPKEETQPRPD